ncbi:MAG TPA: glycosyltransferase family 2 protein [Thermoanaerobaculia bacterium]|nr:glycosyltransferase family 2 protein [Thermoanaerobaculia bacterium]
MSASHARARISALVTTYNEERNIAECLESLLWCDEVLVVDSFSTDRTPAIARRYEKVRFVQRTYHGSASQKNWAIDNTRNEWILIFDADERCTPALRDEILQLFDDGEPEHDTYTINRRCFFLGKPIRFSGWQHDRVVRLLRRGAGRYPNRRVHADMVTRGEAPVLRNPMLHFMVDDFVEYASRIQRYSWWGASQAWREGKRSGVSEVLGRSAWRFARTYLLQGGVLDGMRGLVFCLVQAYGTYLKWSYVWSWGVNQKRGIEPELPSFDESDDTWRGLDELETAQG